ncbi:MAG: InlB B-repeat-containing protein [Roseburia sp.]|nr:InlB B-repeat-containing protein [Roseburia sp.]
MRTTVLRGIDMPISDEIIELAPVKKTKTVMIVMFAAMGALLALAVTFLILYLLKPSFEESTGRVVGVVEDSSSLYQSSTSGGDAAKFASVGNEYTVNVTVAAEGDADPGVVWIVEPAGAVEEKSKGVLSSDESGKTFFFKFVPLSTYADGTTPITITARSVHDVDQLARISFYAVKQGTEEIRLSKYWTSKNTSGISITDGQPLRLPYYASRMNNPVFYISYEQLGANNGDSDSYSALTKVVGTDGVNSTTMVSVTTPNPDVIEIGEVLDSDDVPKFTFKILKAGATATINITANVNNDFAEPLTKTVTINTVSNSDLGYIDAIRVYDEPLTAAYYEANKNNQANLPRSAESITLPYASSYKNFLKHIALSPFSLQYDDTDLKPVSDWSDKLEIVSSDNEVARYVNGSLVIGKFAENHDCELTIRDKTASSLGTEVKIIVKVVAYNPSGTISVNVPATNRTYTEAQLDGMAATTDINTSQGVLAAVMTVEYAISAPATTSRDKIVSLLSNGYKLSVKKDGADVTNAMSVKLATLNYDNGKAVVENYSNSVTVGTASAFTDKTLCVIPGRGDSFIAVAMFQITVNTSGVPDGLYSIEFEKIGVELPGEDNGINLRNRSWRKSFRLNVTENPTGAEFIDADDALDLISSDRTRAGKFIVTRVPQLTTNNNQSYWSGAAAIYVQNRAAADFPFELSRLISLTNADGDALTNQNGTVSVNISTVASSGILSKNDSSTNVRFTGKALNATNSQGPHAEAVITATDSAGKKIGQFEISIYVIDAIDQIYCEETTLRTVYYNRTSYATFEKDSVKSTARHSQATSNYNYNDFDIEYGDGNKLDGTWDTSDGKYAYGASKKTFKIGADTIFEYVKNTGYITAKCDLFEYSYNHAGIDLSDISLVYKLNDEDKYFGADMECSRDYRLERVADGLGIFVDQDYEPSTAVINTLDSAKLSYSFNQGATVNLYSSPIVVIGTDEQVVIRYAESTPKTVAAVRNNAYFTVPSGITVLSCTEITSGSGHYTAASFQAPDVVSTDEPVDKYTFTAVISSSTNFEIRIENYARPIAENGIHIYSDAAYSTPLTALDFGKLTASTDSPYEKPFWLKVTYGAKGSYNKFEAAVMHNLPSYFAVLDKNGTRIERLEFAESDTLVDNETVEYKEKFFLKLLETAEDLDSFSVDIREAFFGGAQPISAAFNLTVRTGLESIALSVGENTEIARISTETASDISYSFKFDDVEDALGSKATLNIPISFNTLAAVQSADGTFNGIAYDYKHKLSATATTASGLSVDVTHIRDDSPYIAVIVNSGTFTAGTVYSFTVTFTDSLGSTSFVASFKVKVLMDVYEISATPTSFELPITGGSTGEKNATVTLQYNNGQSKYAPDDAYLENVQVSVVSKVGNTVTENPAKFRVVKTNNSSYTLYAQNDASGDSYYLRVKYKSLVRDYKITLATSETRIRNTSTNISSSGIATVAVSSATQEFDISAEVYNIGTLNANPSLASSVQYSLYSDAGHNTPISSSVATVTGGKLKFVAPASTSGTIYAVASYTDSQSGKSSSINTTVNYSVTISAVSLGGFGANDKTFVAGTGSNADTIVLYRLDANNYSQIDLTDHIVTSVPFGMSIPSANITKTVTVTGALSAGGLLVKPTGVGTGTITVTAKHGNNAPVSYTCTVTVRGFEDLDNALSINKTALDIVAGDTATLAATALSDYDGITRTYSVAVSNNANGRISLATSGLSTTVSLDRSKFDNQSYYGTYTLTATLTYVVPTSWSASTVGAFIMTATRPFTVNFDYTLDFKLVKSKSGADNDVQTSSTHTADPDAEYKAVLTSAFYSTDWTYSLSSNNGMVAATTFTSSSATLSGLNVKSGAFTLTVTANAYGKTLTKSYSYTFASERSISAAMTANNGTLTFTDNGNTKEATVDIGYSASATPAQNWVFTYTINTSEAIGNVDILWSGDAVAGTKTKNGDAVSMTFTVNSLTRLVVNGTVTSNGITYYTQRYKLELTAVAPQFALSANSESVRPLATSTLSVGNSASAFRGAYTVSYSLISGSDIATLANNVLTAKSNTVGGKAVVCATITITDGVYSGNTYKLYKEIAIVGIPLPSATFASAQTECAVGSSVTLSNALNVATTVTASDNANYIYTSGNMSISYAAESSYFVSGTDYTLNSSTGALSILDTDKTKAGGKLRVTATVSLTGGVNSGSSFTASTDIVIVPTQAKPVTGVVIFGKAGTYDISRAVALYISDRSDSVSAHDTYSVAYTVSGTGAQDITVSGSNLVISSDITDWRTITLNASVTVTSGNYRGKTLTCSTSVKIYDMNANTENKVEFDTTNGVYGSKLAKDMLSGNTSSVTAIEVYAFDNADALRVQHNGTVNAEIFVDTLFNNASGGYKEITVGLIVTTTDGSEHYAVATLKAAYITSSVTATVTFNTNGGSTVASQSVAVGGTVSAPADPTKAGYKFVGWYTDSVCTAGNMYDFGMAVVKPFTLYAKWTADERVIALDGNGAGAVLSKSYIKVTTGSTYSELNDITVTRAGYDFGGWWTTAETGGTRIQATSNVAATGATVLYARWSAKTITVTLVYGDGSSNGSMYVTCGSPYTKAKLTEKTREGYDLIGWYTEANGGGACVYSSSTDTACNVEIGGDHSIYAFWKERYYTITLNADFGNIGGEETRDYYVKHGETLSMLSIVPARSGYVFAGWYTAPNSDEAVTASDTANGDATYYAHWRLSVTVTFDIGDSARAHVITPSAVAVAWHSTYGEFGSLPTPTSYDDGTGVYNFVGWYTAANGSGNEVTDATEVVNMTAHTLYAKWAKTITVTFDIGYAADHNVTAVSNASVTVGSGVSFDSLAELSRDSYIDGYVTYVLTGWSTEANGGGTKYDTDIDVPFTENTTVYAVWELQNN